MIHLFDNETGRALGTISDEHLRFLQDQLEEESREDTDYYINKDTIETFEAQGADPMLLRVLREALGGREDMEIRWEKSA